MALLPIPLRMANFLVHHIHGFTIHVTILTLFEGVLFAHNSHLIPDECIFCLTAAVDTELADVYS